MKNIYFEFLHFTARMSKMQKLHFTFKCTVSYTKPNEILTSFSLIGFHILRWWQNFAGTIRCKQAMSEYAGQFMI